MSNSRQVLKLWVAVDAGQVLVVNLTHELSVTILYNRQCQDIVI